MLGAESNADVSEHVPILLDVGLGSLVDLLISEQVDEVLVEHIVPGELQVVRDLCLTCLSERLNLCLKRFKLILDGLLCLSDLLLGPQGLGIDLSQLLLELADLRHGLSDHSIKLLNSVLGEGRVYFLSLSLELLAGDLLKDQATVGARRGTSRAGLAHARDLGERGVEEGDRGVGVR